MTLSSPKCTSYASNGVEVTGFKTGAAKLRPAVCIWPAKYLAHFFQAPCFQPCGQQCNSIGCCLPHKSHCIWPSCGQVVVNSALGLKGLPTPGLKALWNTLSIFQGCPPQCPVRHRYGVWWSSMRSFAVKTALFSRSLCWLASNWNPSLKFSQDFILYFFTARAVDFWVSTYYKCKEDWAFVLKPYLAGCFRCSKSIFHVVSARVYCFATICYTKSFSSTHQAANKLLLWTAATPPLCTLCILEFLGIRTVHCRQMYFSDSHPTGLPTLFGKIS